MHEITSMNTSAATYIAVLGDDGFALTGSASLARQLLPWVSGVDNFETQLWLTWWASMGDGNMDRSKGRQTCNTAVLPKEVMPATPHTLFPCNFAGEQV